MMDTVLGGTMGVLKQEVTMVTEMIDKLEGRALPQNSLPQDLGSDSNLKNESYGCRHCQENFSTLLNLKQHIICEHTKELQTEIHQYQHKKHRPLDGSGSIHPKKRKILEGYTLEGKEERVKNLEIDFQSNDDDDDDDEDRLVISTSPAPPENASSEPAAVEEYMSYPHKKLKRKDYLEIKGEVRKEKEDLQKEYEKIINKAKKEIDRENNEIRQKLEKTELLYATAKFQGNVQPETKSEHVNDAPPSQLYSAPYNVPHQDIRLPYPPVSAQQSMVPAISMNMYGNFAMPMNFPPHPMAYMNPGMFMPPMTTHQHSINYIPQPNPMPTSPLPSRVAKVSSPGISPHSLRSPKPKKPKSARPSNSKRRNKNVQRKGSQSDDKSEVVEIYECKVCCRKFSQVGNFHNHMKLHSEKTCSCGICKVEFSDSYELQRHMRKTHTGSMPYKCNECDREFSQYNNLRRHLRVHSGNSYKCHICERSFNEIFYLEMHIGSHTGERTYKCGVCHVTFRDNAELQRHVKTHSADELHTCDACGKSFSKACVLRQHKKMHLGIRPYRCKICDKAFIHRHHLTIHMRMHNTSKPYTCKFCHREFTQTSHLYKHIEKQHEEEIRKAVDLNFKNGKKGAPSASEIEVLFCKIQSPSNSSSASVDSGNAEMIGRPRSDSNVSQADSAISLSRSNVSHISMETPPPVEYSSTPQYSPISSASSQFDNEVRSLTPSTEVLPTHSKSNGLSLGQAAARNPAGQTDTKKDSLSHANSQEYSTANPKLNKNKILTTDQSKNTSHYHPDHVQSTCLKTEKFSILPDVSRITDTDQLSQEFRAPRKDMIQKSASSPCSSLSSDSALGITDHPSPTSAILTPESIKVEKKECKEEKPKKRRRRRKKMEADSESIATNDAPPSAPNSQIPSLPPRMPNIPTDVQQMYLMQMQHLQDMHMVLFANSMANQSFPNGPGTKPNSPVTTLPVASPSSYGYGNQMDVFSQASQPRTFSPVSHSRFHNSQSDVIGPMDLSVEKQT